MRNFKVYFELYGKKMTTTIQAENMTTAQQKVKDSIKFHKTVPIDEDKDWNDILDMMEKAKDIFGKM